MSDPLDTSTPAPAGPASDSGQDRQKFGTVDAAVAELERRESERRTARRAEKVARNATDREERASRPPPADDDGEDDDDTGKRLAHGDDVEGDDEDAKPKAKPAKKAAAEDDGDDEDEDLGDDGDDDGQEDDPRKARGEATDEADDDAQDLTTVNLDGKALQIPKGTPKALVDTVKGMAEELKSDYTRKTQEVAQIRASVAHQAQATEALMGQVQAAQAAVLQMAQKIVGEPPPIQLAQTDIQSYTLQKALYEQRMQELQGLMGHGQNLSQQQQQRQQQEQQQHLQQEAQRMVAVMPALASPQMRQQFMQEAVQAAARSGFSPEDVTAVGDHRMYHLLGRLIVAERKLAAREQAGSTVRAKLSNTPPKVTKPGNSSRDQGKGERAQGAKSDFMKSRRTLKDVRAFIERST